ncbi:hypothetical protein AB4F11_04195, partial [Francisella philomiragia]
EGLGYVRSLKESATLDRAIASAIESFDSDISYGEKLSLADTTLLSWARTSESFTSKLDELENLSFDDGTQISFKQGDWLRGVFDKTITLETFSSNKLIQTNLSGDTLTITHGSKSRSYNIVRGQENVLGMVA